MMEPVICIEMLYPGLDPVRKIAEIAGHGFRNIEFWGWKDKNIEAFAEIFRKKELRLINFSGQRRGDLVDRRTHALVIEDIEESLVVAKKLHTPVLMVLTNELGEGGKVLHPCDAIPEKEKYSALVEGLGKIMDRIPADMTVVLEPLNTVLDHAGYYLSDMKTAQRLLRDVGSPRLKILCDLYHQGMMGDDLAALVDTYLDDFGYIHIADYPGRHEPGTARRDWGPLLRGIKNRAWDGFVGFEYSPLGDSGESLNRIRALWDEFVV